MPAKEEIGVSAKVDGVNAFMKNMKGMEQSYDSLVKAVGAGGGKLASSLGETTSAISELGSVAAPATVAVRTVMIAMGTAVGSFVGMAGAAILKWAADAAWALGKELVGALASVVTGIVSLAREASTASGVIDGFSATAARTGVSIDDMVAAAAGGIPTIELMKNANLALTGVSA